MTETPPPSSFIDRDRLAETLETLVGFDTQNPPGETADSVAFLERELHATGLATERLRCAPGKPNLAAFDPDRPAPELVFHGHLDTVPFDASAWTVDPLGERDGDRLYGRGAVDMKGALAAMVETARASAESDVDPALPIGFAFVSDEEVAGENAALSVLDLFADRPPACVIGEQTGTPERPSVAAADKGSIWLRLEATGTAAHGSRPPVGENAIDRLSGAIDRLRTSLSAIEFDLEPAGAALLEDSVAYYAPAMGRSTARRLFERPTVNLGEFAGGESINSVPASASAAVDIRLTAGVAIEPICERVRSLLAAESGVRIRSLESTAGTVEPPDSPLVSASVAAAADATGQRVFRRSATGGGDAKRLRNAGLSAVEFAVGADMAHAVDEWTTVDALVATAHAYTVLPSLFAEHIE